MESDGCITCTTLHLKKTSSKFAIRKKLDGQSRDKDKDKLLNLTAKFLSSRQCCCFNFTVQQMPGQWTCHWREFWGGEFFWYCTVHWMGGVDPILSTFTMTAANPANFSIPKHTVPKLWYKLATQATSLVWLNIWHENCAPSCCSHNKNVINHSSPLKLGFCFRSLLECTQCLWRTPGETITKPLASVASC